MKIKRYMTGPIQVNTYLVYDEESKKGFIVDPGGYCKELTEDAKNLGLDILCCGTREGFSKRQNCRA